MYDSRLGQLATEKNLFNLTVLIMFLMPVSELITDICCNFSGNISPSVFQPVIFGFYGVAGTAAVLLFKSVELTDKKATKNWYAADVFYLVFVFFMILSAVFSKNPGVYSNGDVFVGENPLHFLAYFALFFSGSRIKLPEYRVKLVKSFLVITALQGIIAFFQTFNIEIAYCLLIRHDRAAYGLTQNSNYFGGLSVFLLACITGAFLFSEKIFRKKAFRYLMPILAGLVFYTMMGSRARLAWIGFAAMVLFYVVSGIVMLKGAVSKDALKSYFIRLAAILTVFAAVFAITHLFTNFWSEEIQRTQAEIDGTVDAGLGSDRLINWKYGLESIPHHWATGIGLDNYTEVFFENPNWSEGTYYQAKAHNEYLHILATQGVFAFTAYMFILFRTVVITVKRIFKGGNGDMQALDWMLLGMAVTYAAQASLNCGVINVAMYFWLTLGLLNPVERPLNCLKRKISK